jgi:hypothetical protein
MIKMEIKISYRYKRLIEEIKNKYGLDKVVSGAYKNTIKETIYVHVLDGGDDLVVLDIAPGLKAYRAYRKLIDRELKWIIQLPSMFRPVSF